MHTLLKVEVSQWLHRGCTVPGAAASGGVGAGAGEKKRAPLVPSLSTRTVGRNSFLGVMRDSRTSTPHAWTQASFSDRVPTVQKGSGPGGGGVRLPRLVRSPAGMTRMPIDPGQMLAWRGA